MRPSGRAADEMRAVRFEVDVNKYAEGSCMVHFGDTQVLCMASVEQRVPGWLRGQGEGWVTGQYGMLPRATETRGEREAARGRQGGRTVEIQRLIGRALRAVMDRKALGEMQITVDCDVIQADGGTRTAAISGGYVALHLACQKLVELGLVKATPLVDSVAAVSCGLYDGEPVLDLDYAEDSAADADANFVLTGKGGLVEVQGTAETYAFSRDQFVGLLDLAEKGARELTTAQARAIASA